MQRLPFNPEPLLALFMTAESAGCLAGDLEAISMQTSWAKIEEWFWGGMTNDGRPGGVWRATGPPRQKKVKRKWSSVPEKRTSRSQGSGGKPLRPPVRPFQGGLCNGDGT